VTLYLTLVEVLASHHDQIDRFGGSAGVRDRGLLEAALFRPQTGYYADLIEEAAALWESLEHRAEKWGPVFRKNDAISKI
jgi:death-on-curing protein